MRMGPTVYEIAIKTEVVLDRQGQDCQGEGRENDEKPSAKAKKSKKDDDDDDDDDEKRETRERREGPQRLSSS